MNEQILIELQRQITALQSDLEKYQSMIPQAKIKAGIRVERTTSQTISNASWQTATYDTIDWESLPSDLTSQFSIGVPGRLTCRVAGLYYLNAQIRFAANATGTRGLAIQVNAVSVTGEHRGAFSTQDAQLNISCAYPMVIGDYVQVLLYQSSGGNLNTIASSKALNFSMVKIG